MGAVWRIAESIMGDAPPPPPPEAPPPPPAEGGAPPPPPPAKGEAGIAGMTNYVMPVIPQEAFTIYGDDMQILHVPMEPGQVMRCEQGTFNYGSHDLKMKVGMINNYQGTGAAIGGAFTGALGGESLFCCHYTNESQQAGYIGVTPNIPAKLIPITPAMLQTGFKCRRGAWVAHIGAVNVSVTMIKGSCAAMCCGGMSLFIQSLHSNDPHAYAFIQGCGTIMSRHLAPGETIVVDGDSILAMDGTIEMDIRMAGSCVAMCCGGEGLFNTELKGGATGGNIFLQSMPIEKLRKLFPKPPANEGGGGGDGGGGGGGGA